ncbi:MAG: hypothetical protein H6811_11655 [Phycisphaeraceae bacterium]|nr:hypothetical protein [Phycisphaeraceae bacterium]
MALAIDTSFERAGGHMATRGGIVRAGAIALIGLSAGCCCQDKQKTSATEGHAASAPLDAWDIAIPTPLKDGVRFSARITHPYLPLSDMGYAELLASDERVVREVQPETRVVGGVECLVMAEKEFEGGDLKEISYNFFAQDEHGNVFYFGEDVDDYEDGEIVGHGGAWLVGRNATEPCLFLPGDLAAGVRFKPENSPPDAEEWAEIEGSGGAMTLGGRRYGDVLVVRETTIRGRWQERKYYARGVGLISENRELNLASAGEAP